MTHLNRVLDDEHAHFERVLDDVRFLAEHRSFQQAAQRFAEARLAMERHAAVEERELLPALQRARTLSEAVRTRVIAQHQEISALNEAVACALSQWNLVACAASLGALGRILHRHHADEATSLRPPQPQRSTR